MRSNISLKEQTVELDITVPDNMYQTLLEQLLEREYLNDNESYDLLARWQGVLSSLHAWGYRAFKREVKHHGWFVLQE